MQKEYSSIEDVALPGEVFKEYLPGYFISNQGRWFSCITGKILSQAPNRVGYLRVSLYKNGKRKHIFTHIAVVVAFGDCKGKKIPKRCKSLRDIHMSIDHLDFDKTNPTISNLQLVSHSLNCLRRSKKYKLANA